MSARAGEQRSTHSVDLFQPVPESDVDVTHFPSMVDEKQDEVSDRAISAGTIRKRGPKKETEGRKEKKSTVGLRGVWDSAPSYSRLT